MSSVAKRSRSDLAGDFWMTRSMPRFDCSIATPSKQCQLATGDFPGFYTPFPHLTGWRNADTAQKEQLVPEKSGRTLGKPDYVVELERCYGMPSQEAFGSSVFYDAVNVPKGSLEQLALAKYKHFAGELWERYGEDNWMAEWETVYTRDPSTTRDIVAELRSISDRGARLSASLLVENNDHTTEAHAALGKAFDDSRVSELQVFKIGDGDAMSGILIASRRPNEGSVFLVLLMD